MVIPADTVSLLSAGWLSGVTSSTVSPLAAKSLHSFRVHLVFFSGKRFKMWHDLQNCLYFIDFFEFFEVSTTDVCHFVLMMLLLVVDVLIFILLFVGVIWDENGVISSERHRLVLKIFLKELGPELAI